MPMCQTTAPPMVFLAGPLQAPLGWLFIVGFLAFVMWVVPFNYRTYLRQHPSALYRRVGLALLGGALLLWCMGEMPLFLVVIPSRDALSAWLSSQGASLDASHCPDTASTALLDTYDRLYSSIDTWQLVVPVFWFVGFGVALIWFYWRARRHRAQPARQ